MEMSGTLTSGLGTDVELTIERKNRKYVEEEEEAEVEEEKKDDVKVVEVRVQRTKCAETGMMTALGQVIMARSQVTPTPSRNVCSGEILHDCYFINLIH